MTFVQKSYDIVCQDTWAMSLDGVNLEKGILVVTLSHKILPWEAVLVLDEVPADISTFFISAD